MKIGYNAPSMQAYNALLKTDRGMLASSAKLSSGVKINSASQNAAGLAISNNLRTQSSGQAKSSQNASNAISILQTVDGTLNEMHSLLQRMRELGVQAANDTNTDEDRMNLQAEIDELCQELNDMSDRCEYNKTKLLRGGASGGLQLTFHVGSNKDHNMKVDLPELSSKLLNVYSNKSAPGEPNPVNLVSDPKDLLIRADDAIDRISRLRSVVGAYHNRLEHTVSYLDASHNASSTSLSRIYDTDMAFEMSNYSRLQVLTQTANAMMAQANQTPQNVLQLLQ